MHIELQLKLYHLHFLFSLTIKHLYFLTTRRLLCTIKQGLVAFRHLKCIVLKLHHLEVVQCIV
jgi:hypothetical protein